MSRFDKASPFSVKTEKGARDVGISVPPFYSEHGRKRKGPTRLRRANLSKPASLNHFVFRLRCNYWPFPLHEGDQFGGNVCRLYQHIVQLVDQRAVPTTKPSQRPFRPLAVHTLSRALLPTSTTLTPPNLLFLFSSLHHRRSSTPHFTTDHPSYRQPPTPSMSPLRPRPLPTCYRCRRHLCR